MARLKEIVVETLDAEGNAFYVQGGP